MKKKFKIAFVGNTAWSMYNFRLGVIRELRDQGHEIIVIAPKDTFSAKLISEGVTYRNINISNYSTNWFGEFKTLLRFIRLYRKEKFDFIFHYTIKPNIYGSIAAYFNGIPSIAITTGLGHFLNFKKSTAGLFTLNLYRLTGRLAKEIWFLNNDDKNIFLEENIVKEPKTKVIRGEGININWYKPNGYVKKDDKIRFLFAGRVIWEKGIGEYVEAAKIIKSKYPNVEFEVLGFIDPSNPHSVPYDQVVLWQKNKWIKYLGEATDVRPYLERCDCLVFPSYYREGLSRILLEAAALERPIVTTDNVGCRDVVDDGVTGYLCKPKNVDDLIEKIEKILSLNQEEMKKMGVAGKKKIEDNFNEKKIHIHYSEALNHYLGN